jgi:protein SCO1
MRRATFISTVLVLCVCGRLCGQDFPSPPRTMVPTATNKPSILQDVGIDQKLGAMVPLDLTFNDEQGRAVRLGDELDHRPVVLVLVYYQCPMLCTMVLNDLVATMRSMPETAGQDYDVLTVSFDPRDTPVLASLKKETYLAQYNRPGAERGWHFLTGEKTSIKALTDAVGFRYVWEPKFQMYAHASGIMVLTPGGKVSRYFYGVDYAPKDLRIALDEASGGHVGGLADSVLLYCFCYDPATGKYGLAISRMLKIGGVLTVLCLGSFVARSVRREIGDAKDREAAT